MYIIDKIAELQLSIWRAALQEPRVVTIDLVEITLQYGQICNKDDILCFSARSPPPPVMSTCTDSRAEAMSVYTKAFKDGTKPRYTYINFDIDTIVMEASSLASSAPEDRMAIRHLALMVYDFMEYEEKFLWCQSGVMWMKYLEHLTVVGQGWDGDDWDEDDLPSFKGAMERGYHLPLYSHPEGWTPPENPPQIRVVRAGEDGSFGAVMDKYTT